MRIFRFISLLIKTLKIINITTPASIISVGRKMSAVVSGKINLSWIEMGTRKTIRRRNLSMAKKAINAISNAGEISQKIVAPVLISIIEITRKIMLRTNAPVTVRLSLITLRYFDLFFIPYNRV
jgi:hypothetical protein